MEDHHRWHFLGFFVPRNGTEELCQGNIQCIYDYQLTGKESIAESTKQFNARFMQVVSEIEPGE